MQICTIDDLAREYQIFSNDLIIVHIIKDTYVLTEMIELARVLHMRSKIRDIVILSSDYPVIPYDLTECCRIIQCSAEQLERLEKSYSVLTHTSNLLFDSLNRVYDADPMELLGVNGISGKEILALTLFDDAGILSAGTEEVTDYDHERRFIDWELTDPSAPYCGCVNLNDMIQVAMNGLLHDNDEIALFAVTPSMKRVMNILKNKYRVTIIDNDPGKWGNRIEGIEIRSPECLIRKKYIIFVTSARYREIFEQLFAEGYKPGENLFALHESVLSFKKSKETVSIIKNKLTRGEELYRKIREKREDRWYYINPHTGTGDVYLSWLYISQNKTAKKIDFCLLVHTENCYRLAKQLEMPVEIFDLDDMSDLVFYARYIGMNQTRIKVLNYSFEQYVVSRIRAYKGIDYNTMLQKTVFHSAFRPSAKRFSQNDTSSFFDRNGLTIGRTVLLSPHAVHTHASLDSFWSDLSRWLSDQGYNVCTNVYGEESVIDGTIAMKLDYSEILDFVDKAGGFIGIRSGLCDIVSATSSKMIILYPRQIVSKYGSYYDYFSLEKMGLRKDDLLEMEFCNSLSSEQTTMIKTYVKKHF